MGESRKKSVSRGKPVFFLSTLTADKIRSSIGAQDLDIGRDPLSTIYPQQLLRFREAISRSVNELDHHVRGLRARQQKRLPQAITRHSNNTYIKRSRDLPQRRINALVAVKKLLHNTTVHTNSDGAIDKCAHVPDVGSIAKIRLE